MKQLLIALALMLMPTAYATNDFNAQVEALAREFNSNTSHETTTVTGDVKKKQLTIPKFDLLQHLNFTGCRVTQGEDSHILKANGSMYAIDIACGADVTIVAPNYLYGEYQYTVAKVGRDKYLGDYVTIDFALPDNKVGTLVYGHTSTPLKVGDKLKAGELLGKYSPSGKTTGPHTHIELWEGGKNYTFDWKKSNNKSMRLRVQRGRASYADVPTVVEMVKETTSDLYSIIHNFLAKYEGFRLKAYHDGGTRCSIGYGTKATSCSETITYEEANRRLDEALKWRIDKIQSDYPNANVNQQAALVSLYYNCPSGYAGLGGSPTKYKRTKCSTSGGKFLRGLYNRRLAERELYNK